MNFDSVSNFSVARPQFDIIESQGLENSVMNIYETSLKTQPSIKSSEYGILSAESFLKASKGRISPTLSFNASMGTGTSGLAKDIIGVKYVGVQPIGFTSKLDTVYSPETQYITRKKSLTDQFRDNVNKSLGFTVNIPLFNGLQTHTAIKNAKINALNARFTQDLAEQTLYKNIAQAHANAKAALNKYNASKLNVDAAGTAFEYAQQKFNAGAISAMDFNTSKNRLFAAESNLLQAKYDYMFKLKVIDYYLGKPLGF
jgi:outer membrane protein